MTDPTENEEINEELSTDELKSVSGGLTIDKDGDLHFVESAFTDASGNSISSLRNPIDPKGSGSGSGMTNEDYKKSKEKRRVEFGNRCFVKQSYD